MAQVITLSEVRAERKARDKPPDAIQKPVHHLPDILSRDYSTPKGALYAALKIREILNYTLYEEPVWRDLVLELAESAYSLSPETSGKMREAVLALKHYVARHTSDANRREIGMASIILAFLEQGLARAPAMGE